MKRFILYITILMSGVLLTCASLIAEGCVVGGMNATAPHYNIQFDSQTTAFTLIIGAILFVVGLILSIVHIARDKNHKN